MFEALRAGRARRVWVARGAHGEGVRELIREAEAASIPVEHADRQRLDSRAAGVRHQGAVAEVTLPAVLGERDLARRRWRSNALVLVLDGVTDPHNLGACARSAEAAGADVLVIRRQRGAGITPAALRASAGALLHLPTAAVANIARALGRLRDAGFWVVGLEGRTAATLDELDPPAEPLAIVAGAEGEGLSRLVGEACDELVSIPLAGRVGSLNVSVATGVALFHPAVRRAREPKKKDSADRFA